MNRLSTKTYVLIAIALLVGFAATLFFMGQVPICKCGYIKLWHGVTYSSENSQHISDWYTFSHIIHGFIFYWIFRALGKKFGWALGVSFLLALFTEISWEIFENTDF